MLVQPYVFFDGRCEEAFQFYEKAVGARLEMKMKYKESPEKHPPGMLPPGYEEKIMHMSFHVGKSLVMASDGMCGGDAKFEGMSLALSVDTEGEAQKVFAALSEGGNVQMPMNKTFFSPAFGMVADKFGVHWMIMATPAS